MRRPPVDGHSAACWFMLIGVSLFGCKMQGTRLAAEDASGPQVGVCIDCHAKQADLPAALKNAAGMTQLIPYMNTHVKDVMVKRSNLTGDAATAFESFYAAGKRTETFAGATCGKPGSPFPKIAAGSSLLGDLLQAALQQQAVNVVAAGSRPWQKAAVDGGTPAALLTERNAVNPFMYGKMGYHSDGAREFPWLHTAATDLSPDVVRETFLIASQSGAFEIGLRDRSSSPSYFGTSTNVNGPQPAWNFLPGTIFGERLMMTYGGQNHTYEIRLRRKVAAGVWAIDVLRPFASRAELDATLQKLCGSGDCGSYKPTRTPTPPKTVNVKSIVNAAAFGTQRDPLTLSSTAGSALIPTAAVDELPKLPAEVVKTLLQTPFKSVFGQPWVGGDAEVKGWAPGNTQSDFHIVPRNYFAAFVPMTLTGCMNCHTSAGRHVDNFDPTREQMYAPAPDDAPRPRTWYNFIPGNDAIFSFHPFTEQAVTSGAATLDANKSAIAPSVLEQCLTSLARPAQRLADDLPLAGAARPTSTAPAAAYPGPSPGSTSSDDVPGTAPASSTQPPANPSTGAVGSGTGACRCVVVGSSCQVRGPDGRVLITASVADICASSAVCTEELYGDVKGSCAKPLQVGQP